jgi:hypothetical protein
MIYLFLSFFSCIRHFGIFPFSLKNHGDWGTLPIFANYARQVIMPRQERFDAPHVLHHVKARGIERSRIFRDDHDQEDFVKRVGPLATSGGL